MEKMFGKGGCVAGFYACNAFELKCSSCAGVEAESRNVTRPSRVSTSSRRRVGVAYEITWTADKHREFSYASGTWLRKVSNGTDTHYVYDIFNTY